MTKYDTSKMIYFGNSLYGEMSDELDEFMETLEETNQPSYIIFTKCDKSSLDLYYRNSSNLIEPSMITDGQAYEIIGFDCDDYDHPLEIQCLSTRYSTWINSDFIFNSKSCYYIGYIKDITILKTEDEEFLDSL